MLQSVVQPLVRRVTDKGSKTLIQRAIASLRARGTDAHLWLPGGDVRTYGPELVANGDFSNGLTGWGAAYGATLSVVAGALRITNTGAWGQAQQMFSVVSGMTYKLSVTFVGGTAPVNIRFSNVAYNTTPVYSSGAISTSISVSFVAASNTAYLSLESCLASVGSYVDLDNISVREITSITPTITSGLTTGNYLESTGNTLATVDNPCGLVLDALGSVGSELVSPIDFTAGWTQSGAAVTPISATSFSTVGVSNYYKAYLTVDAWYELTCTATFTSQLTIYNASSALNAVYPTTIVSGVPFTTHFKALATQLNFRLASAGTLTITNISVREVSGIHLTQGTTQNKPVLRRGLTNLLTYSSDFSNAAWTKTSVTVAGTNIVEDSTTSTHIVRRDYAFSAGVYTIAVEAKVGIGTRNIGLLFPASVAGALFNPVTGAVVSLAGAPTTSAILQPNGYWLFTVTATIAAITDNCRVYLGNASTWTAPYSGDGASSVDVRTAALFQGTLTAAQIIGAGGIPVTTTAAASNPDAGKYSWSFDGTDFLQTTGGVAADGWAVVSCTPSALAYQCPFGGLGPINETGYAGFVFKLRNTGDIWFRVGNGDSNPAHVHTITKVAGYSANTPVVLAMRWNDGVFEARVNGVSAGTATITYPPETSTNAHVIGKHSLVSSTESFSGSISYVNHGAGLIADAELLLIERHAASAAGITF